MPKKPQNKLSSDKQPWLVSEQQHSAGAAYWNPSGIIPEYEFGSYNDEKPGLLDPIHLNKANGMFMSGGAAGLTSLASSFGAEAELYANLAGGSSLTGGSSNIWSGLGNFGAGLTSNYTPAATSTQNIMNTNQGSLPASGNIWSTLPPATSLPQPAAPTTTPPAVAAIGSTGRPQTISEEVIDRDTWTTIERDLSQLEHPPAKIENVRVRSQGPGTQVQMDNIQLYSCEGVSDNFDPAPKPPPAEEPECDEANTRNDLGVAAGATSPIIQPQPYKVLFIIDNGSILLSSSFPELKSAVSNRFTEVHVVDATGGSSDLASLAHPVASNYYPVTGAEIATKLTGVYNTVIKANASDGAYLRVVVDNSADGLAAYGADVKSAIETILHDLANICDPQNLSSYPFSERRYEKVTRWGREYTLNGHQSHKFIADMGMGFTVAGYPYCYDQHTLINYTAGGSSPYVSGVDTFFGGTKFDHEFYRSGSPSTNWLIRLAPVDPALAIHTCGFEKIGDCPEIARTPTPSVPGGDYEDCNNLLECPPPAGPNVGESPPQPNTGSGSDPTEGLIDPADCPEAPECPECPDPGACAEPASITSATCNNYETGGAGTPPGTVALSAGDKLSGAQVQIDISKGGSLSYPGSGAITGAWDSGTGTLSLSGCGTPAEYEAALNSVTYNNAGPVGSPISEIVTYTLDNGASDMCTMNVSDPTLDPASIDSIACNSYETGSGDATPATVTMSGQETVDSATVSVCEGTLNFTNTSKIAGSWDSGSSTLSLTGTATVAEYQTAFNSITYNHPGPVN